MCEPDCVAEQVLQQLSEFELEVTECSGCDANKVLVFNDANKQLIRDILGDPENFDYIYDSLQLIEDEVTDHLLSTAKETPPATPDPARSVVYTPDYIPRSP